MDFEIKNLGLTLCLGAVFVHSIHLVLRCLNIKYFNQTTVLGALDFEKKEIVLYLALIFGSGILIEDLTKSVSANRGDNSVSKFIQYFAVKKEEDIRVGILLKSDRIIENERILGESTNLMKELFMSSDSGVIVKEYKMMIEKYFLNGRDSIQVIGENSVKEFKECVNGIYYQAKNKVFKSESYFTELREIYLRITFARGLVYIILFMFVAFVLTFGFCFTRDRNWFSTLNAKHLVIVIVFSPLCFYLCKLAYEIESENYFLRVYGYFVS